MLKAPFPWFGGKSRAAHLIWSRLGDVSNYVEPFAGSLAVMLARPHTPRIETVNDRDCYLANFWRALKSDPERVARYADWPVNEADLHARHRWLCSRKRFAVRMLAEPDYYDAKIAGWWAWGISQWIGGGWCSKPEWSGRGAGGRSPRGINTVDRRRPANSRMGVLKDLRPSETCAKRPVINRGGRGVTRELKAAMTFDGMRPCVNSGGVHRKRPHLSGNGPTGVDSARGPLLGWMLELAERLRRVRVCCGDFARVLTPSCTWKVGGGTLTGVLLDPPYSHAMRDRMLYAIDVDIAVKVRAWAIAAGENPRMRVALCGLEGEHEMPGWEEVRWNAPRGYSKKVRREVIWFSPHCLKQRSLFDALGAVSA